jgi:hypothetical protein
VIQMFSLLFTLKNSAAGYDSTAFIRLYPGQVARRKIFAGTALHKELI